MEFFKTFWPDIISGILIAISVVFTALTTRRSSKTKLYVELLDEIPELVTRAEALFGAKKGEAKLDYVLTHSNMFALQNHLKINNEGLKDYIEKVITTTKNVNTNGIVPDDTPNGGAVSKDGALSC